MGLDNLINFQFQTKNAKGYMHLQEEKTAKEGCLNIEGRYFSVSFEGKEDSELQEKIKQLMQEPELTVPRLITTINQIKEDELDPRYRSLTAIQKVVLDELNQRAESYKQDPFYQKAYAHLCSETEKGKQLVEELETLEDEIKKLDSSTFLSSITSAAQRIFLELQQRRLTQTIKDFRLEWLQNKWKVYQLIPVLTSEGIDKAKSRLDDMLGDAILIEHLAYVNQMIHAGAEINNYHMFLAIVLDSEKLIKRLMQAGIKPESRNKLHGNSLLEIACTRGKIAEHAIRAFADAGCDLTTANERTGKPAIYCAIESDLDNAGVVYLLDKIKNLNFSQSAGGSLLHAAIYRLRSQKDPTILRALIERGCQSSTTDQEGRTPLHLACLLLNNDLLIDAAVGLLFAGNDVKATDEKNYTVLHYLAQQAPKLDGTLISRLAQIGSPVKS